MRPEIKEIVKNIHKFKFELDWTRTDSAWYKYKNIEIYVTSIIQKYGLFKNKITKIPIVTLIINGKDLILYQEEQDLIYEEVSKTINEKGDKAMVDDIKKQDKEQERLIKLVKFEEKL